MYLKIKVIIRMEIAYIFLDLDKQNLCDLDPQYATIART